MHFVEGSGADRPREVPNRTDLRSVRSSVGREIEAVARRGARLALQVAPFPADFRQEAFWMDEDIR